MDANSAVLDIERGQLGEIRPLYWQTDTSVSNKIWGYIEHDTFKSPEFIVHQLIDIVSKNGNLLMNIGPKSDGTIPDEVQQVLLSDGCVAQGQRRRDLRHSRVDGLMARGRRKWLRDRFTIPIRGPIQPKTSALRRKWGAVRD